ncbi:MAG: carbamoyltransferase [Candidatus Scalindua rubra]|uniref:Carbamoyltransferase n=1 Tax=Candidatus Scalindua rubra TaxID=1872076 RepID=A0A1E3XCE3_9BACT|nr:MAG: carbamoyltransferase [Candidatus Scalindua rubra]
MYILGINSAYHEPSACLIKDGKIVAAVEEERFNRVRHGKFAMVDNPHWLPEESIKYCLKEANISVKEIDYIGFSFRPEHGQGVSKGSSLPIAFPRFQSYSYITGLLLKPPLHFLRIKCKT